LVARLDKGKHRGAVWTGGKVVGQIKGGSIDEVWKKLVDHVAERQGEQHCA
jgi:hypothetical protein